jgi:hypothetical protein
VRQVLPLIGPCQIQRRAQCLFGSQRLTLREKKRGILAGCFFSPIDPPIAIICRCLPFNLRARGESAVRCAAASTSKTLPSAPRAAGRVIEAFGSRLKLSHIRFRNPSLRETKAPSYVEVGELPEPLRLPSWPVFSISRTDWRMERCSLSGLCGGALSRITVKVRVG